MEPEVSAFLARIAKSISLVLIWMLINTLFGIKKGYFFVDEKLGVGNIVFYVWFIGSLVLLMWYIMKIWKRAPVYDAKEDVWKTPENSRQSSVDSNQSTID